MMMGRGWVRGIVPGARTAIMAVSAAAMVGIAMPAAAQVDESRMRKVEAEVRALQRKVFPAGDGRFFAQDNTVGTSTASSTIPPATTPMTDVLARLDALETSLAALTSQVETNTNALARLSGRVAALEPASTASPPPVVVSPGSGGVTTLTPTASKPATTAATPKPAAPSSARLAQVQAIAKPSTADAGDDEYSYGFRLWEAKLYPEAQQQLQLYVQKYPKHRMISHGRNLLGRAYLDNGKPKDAAPWFVKNYDDDVQGARAPDSLLYLVESMIALKDTKRACIALAKFGETYPAFATGRLKAQYDANRTKVKCN